MLACALVLIACESSSDERDEPVDCDAAIVPLLPLHDNDRFYVDAVREGEATAFIVIDDDDDERRLVFLEACGAEPRTIIDHAYNVQAFDGPWLATFLGEPGDGEVESWICDPFGGRPNQRLPDGTWWYGELYTEGLLVHRGDELLALPYDARGFGELRPFRPIEPRACEIVVDGVSYWLRDRNIVAEDLAAKTSTVVFEGVDDCSHTPDHAVMLLSRGSDDSKRRWAFEPATARVVMLPDVQRADVRRLMIEPQLRLLWLDEDWTSDWLWFAMGTAPDGTALLAADGSLYRLAPDETEPFWIGDHLVGHGAGDLVSIGFADGAFYVWVQQDQRLNRTRLYRLVPDGTGFTDLFGRFVYEIFALPGDRWAFTAD
jgi:hypothetical protein